MCLVFQHPAELDVMVIIEQSVMNMLLLELVLWTGHLLCPSVCPFTVKQLKIRLFG